MLLLFDQLKMCLHNVEGKVIVLLYLLSAGVIGSVHLFSYRYSFSGVCGMLHYLTQNTLSVETLIRKAGIRKCLLNYK